MKVLYWIIGIIIVAALLYLARSAAGTNPPSTMDTTQASPVVIPIEHASVVLRWGNTTVYADPVGDASLYASQPKPDIILVTHEHGDHYNPDTIAALMQASTTLVVNERVAQMLPGGMKKNLVVMKNGDTETIAGLGIVAVPAYNVRPEAQNFHPQGRDNGYVLEAGGTRVYIAGDTEGTPEMKALQNIDIAFVPMNLPYTMSVDDAAAAVLAFKPRQVYPYHYRGQEGLSDVSRFKDLVAQGDPHIEVMLAQWYPEEE
jgi:L-ascorbate metabolism protein UlaG (beta-lactamase superfamily)